MPNEELLRLRKRFLELEKQLGEGFQDDLDEENPVLDLEPDFAIVYETDEDEDDQNETHTTTTESGVRPSLPSSEMSALQRSSFFVPCSPNAKRTSAEAENEGENRNQSDRGRDGSLRPFSLEASSLPRKLWASLHPFQKEAVVFAVKRQGRLVLPPVL